MRCYHATTPERLCSILANGLLPNSSPTWFMSPTPYIMLSLKPWLDLNVSTTVILEVEDPEIRPEYFDDPEGLRWPNPIKPEHLTIFAAAGKVVGDG